MKLSRRRLLIVALLVLLTVPAYYLISPLFITTFVNEELPSSVSIVSQGSFQSGAPGHQASGTATLYRTAGGSYLIRFESFSVTNGPNLHVYVAKSQDPGQDFKDLGPLKGSSGNQNYDLPSGADPQIHNTVLVWCVAFSVLFGYATYNQ